MARTEKSKQKKTKISVWNWLGTLALSAVPGVNLIAWILFLIFSKNQNKRSFAVGCIVLTVILAVLVCAAFVAFPGQLSRLAEALRGGEVAALAVPPV